MKAAQFSYLRAADVASAVAALAAGGGEAKAFGGGQSLGPMLNLRLARPAQLVDVGRLASLKTMTPHGNGWRIGGAVTHAMLEDQPLAGCEMIAAVAGNIAYRAIRNRGTVGGSLAHADPAADWPLAFAALGASLLLAGPKGERSVPADAFMTGTFATQLREDEIIAAVDVTKPGEGYRWGYWKFCRKTGEFPEASAALLLDPSRKLARLFMGALDGPPKELPLLARDIALRGEQAVSEKSVSAAFDAAGLGFSGPVRTLRVTAVRRAVKMAVGS
jgi:carbon-monoxide dehydrogenase medium subunit